MNEPSRPVAIVTGSSRGIGAAIAERLARDGHAVVINYAGRRQDADAIVERWLSRTPLQAEYTRRQRPIGEVAHLDDALQACGSADRIASILAAHEAGQSCGRFRRGRQLRSRKA